MPEALPQLSTPAPQPIVKVKRFPVSEDRRRKYVEGLRLSGSHKYASWYATSNGNPSADPGQPGHGYTTFYRLRKTDADFRRDCEYALVESLGKLEESVMRRAYEPDRAPVITSDGQVVGERLN